MAASQKLSHLLQLADQGPALRAALAEEVAELLSRWPSDYPESMREVCETLLAKAARDVDLDTRARLRIGRCFGGRVYAVTAPPAPSQTNWPYQIAYKWGALMKALLLQRSC